MSEVDYKALAQAAGWRRSGSHFTRFGVSISYVDWKTLCREEGLLSHHAQRTRG